MTNLQEWNVESPGRYERQTSIWNQNLLEKAKVLVLGAGAIGNEVVKDLALAGIGRMTIVDTDVVELVNLNRCALFREADLGLPKAEAAALRAHEINPDTTCVSLQKDIILQIGAGFYKGFDVVVSCLDNREARLFANKYAYGHRIPLVDGAIEGLNGRVRVIVPPRSSCYECDFTEAEYDAIRDKYSCSGVQKNPNEATGATVITSAAVIGAMQSLETVELLHSRYLSAGKEWIYLAREKKIELYQVPRNEGCPAHVDFTTSTKIDESNEITATELNEIVKSKLHGNGEIHILNDKLICYAVSCQGCGSRKEIGTPLGSLQRKDVWCSNCSSEMITDISYEVRQGNYSLQSLGIPPQHILRVEERNTGFFLELGGHCDRS